MELVDCLQTLSVLDPAENLSLLVILMSTPQLSDVTSCAHFWGNN